MICARCNDSRWTAVAHPTLDNRTYEVPCPDCSGAAPRPFDWDELKARFPDGVTRRGGDTPYGGALVIEQSEVPQVSVLALLRAAPDDVRVAREDLEAVCRVAVDALNRSVGSGPEIQAAYAAVSSIRRALDEVRS